MLGALYIYYHIIIKRLSLHMKGACRSKHTSVDINIAFMNLELMSVRRQLV